VAFVKQTSLLTHCTNPCPLNFNIFYHKPRNSGVKSRAWNGAEKAPAACKNSSPKSDQATDWPQLDFIIFFVLIRNSESKNRAKPRNRYFSPVSLVWVPPTCRHSQYPCPKFDLALLPSLFPAKVGAKYAPGPAEPNDLDITSSILHSDEVYLYLYV
jgi:hypothetical protein